MPRPTAPDRRAARRALDRRFEKLRGFQAEATTPRAGWSRAIREALGMSLADLAARMDISATSVASLERGEREGRVQLDTLQRAADALGCDLVYALVPRRPLEAVVRDRAVAKATVGVGTVAHSMLLEDQAVAPDAARAHVEEQADRLVDRPGLWLDA